jgi:hypothetical protein
MNLLTRKGTTERRPVRDEVDGGIAGVHVEHWDDHVDAIALAKRARLHIPEHGLYFPDHRGLLLPEHVVGIRDAKPVKAIAGGAFSASGLYVANWIDVLDGTQLAIDLSLTTHKWALYTNTLTPNFSSDVSYSSTNEITGTGYTAGGKDLTGLSPTTTESPTGTLRYDHNDQSWTSATITARGAIEYAEALAGNNLIVAMTFGADITSTAGAFTIQFAAGGIFTIDLTP